MLRFGQARHIAEIGHQPGRHIARHDLFDNRRRAVAIAQDREAKGTGTLRRHITIADQRAQGFFKLHTVARNRMADRESAAGLVIRRIEFQRARIGRLRRRLFPHQIKRQRLIGEHLTRRHPRRQRPFKLHQRLTSAARSQVNPGQALRHARMIGIEFRRPAKEPDRGIKIVNAHRRRPGLNQGIAVTRGLRQRDQCAVQALHFWRRQWLHHFARNHILRLCRGCDERRGDRGQRQRQRQRGKPKETSFHHSHLADQPPPARAISLP